jgi:DNA-binding MurR/RpiR family transcriptional regulator
MLEDRLRQKYRFLTKTQKDLANFFLLHGEEAAFSSIKKLADQLHISEATIVRFAKAIGYKGYPSLQQELQVSIRKKLAPSKILQTIIHKDPRKNLFQQIYEMDAYNHSETAKANRDETIAKVINEIIAAKRIGITAHRSTYAIAFLLAFFLGQLREHCEILDTSKGLLPHSLKNYGPKDLIIGISFPRYTAQTLKILEWGKKTGCRIVAITDRPVSPIGQLADTVLLASHKSVAVFNSLVGPVTIVNLLTAGVSMKRKSSLKYLKFCEPIVQHLEVFLK